MAPSRTSTMKSKHATSKSGIKNSKVASTKHVDDGIVKQRSAKSKKTNTQGVSLRQQPKHIKTKTGDLQGKGSGDGGLEARLKKKFGKARRVYTEKELGVPVLNMITPVGVEKPKGGKKGKVFVDDRVSLLVLCCGIVVCTIEISLMERNFVATLVLEASRLTRYRDRNQ